MAQEKYLGENGLKRLVGLVKEDLGTKANIDGSYDGLQAGSAKQIVSPTGITDTTPYVFRTTCGETSISGGDEQLASLKGIRGNTIAWNQLINVSSKANTTLNGITFTNNHDGSYTLNGTATAQTIFTLNQPGVFTKGHKYLVKGCPSGGSTSTYNLYIDYFKNDTGNGFIHTLNTDLTGLNVKMVVESGTTINNLVFRPQIFDLTQMFGPGNEPTSVLEFTRLFPKTYYPYNAGEPRNVKIIGLKSTGYNACNGIFQIRQSDTLKRCIESEIIPAVAGQTYVFEKPTFEDYQYRHFQVVDENGTAIRQVERSKDTEGTIEITLSANERYLRVQYWYYEENHYTNVPSPEILNTCVHLKWSGSRTGYAPNEEHVLHIDTSRYFPDGMNGVGTAYDELTPKVAIKRFAKDDLGKMPWVKVSKNRFASYGLSKLAKKPINDSTKANIICTNYANEKADDVYLNSNNNIIAFNSDGTLFVYVNDTYYENTSENDFKQAMSGVPIIYERSEPVVTEIPQVRDNHWEIKVDDYGTEEFLFAEGDEIPVPVGHETLYMDNLVDKLRNLPDPSEYQVLKEKVDSIISVPTLPTDTSKSYVLEFTSGTLKWTEKQQ